MQVLLIQNYIKLFLQIIINIVYSLLIICLSELGNYKFIYYIQNPQMGQILILVGFNICFFYFLIICFFIYNSFYFFNNTITVLYKFIVSLFGLIFIYGFYTKLNIITFLVSISLILIFSQFITYIQMLNLENKILLILANKNYIKWIERIIFIKILLFYCYLYDNTMFFCDSFWTRLAHDTFMELGAKIGAKPQTTVSFLETTGMLAIVGLLGYSSIKLYQYSTGTMPSSVNDRLTKIEEKLNRIESKCDQTQEINTVILDKQLGTIKYLGDTFNPLSIFLAKLETDIVNIGITQNAFITKVLETNAIFQEKFTKYNGEVLDKIKIQLEVNFNVINKKMEDYIAKISSTSNLDPQMQVELTRLQDEILTLLNMQNNLVSEIPTESTSLIARPKHLLSEEIFNQNPALRNLPIFQRAASDAVLDSQVKKNKTQMDSLLNYNHPPIPRPRVIETSSITDLTKYQYKMIETTDGFAFKKIDLIPRIPVEPSTAIGTITSRVFNGLPMEFMLRTVSTVVGNAIAGSITLNGLQSLLNVLGLGGSSSSSTPQRVGQNTVSVIRDFLKGITDEIRKK